MGVDRRIIHVLLLLLAVAQAGIVMAPRVSADQTVGAAPTMWHTRQLELSVRMQGEPQWAHDSVIRAMAEWNLQQEKFIHEFYPNESNALPAVCVTNPGLSCVQGVDVGANSPSDMYVLYEDESTANPMVTITFSPAHSQQAMAIEQTFLQSELAITDQENGRFTISVLASLTNVPDTATSGEVLYRIILHELGHVMGLGHIFDGKDIMDGNAYFLHNLSRPSYISTVDLYAIRQLALLGDGTLRPYAFILIPTSIPYQLNNVDQSSLPTGLDESGRRPMSR